MIIPLEDIDNLIKGQKSTIKFYIVYAICIFLFGVGVILIRNFLPDDEDNGTIKNMAAIGGCFIASLSSFPIKEVITRKEKISTYNLIKNKLVIIINNEIEIDTQENQQVIILVWEIIKKSALN